MPVKPENRKLYPANWPAISRLIREHRAGWQCEMVVSGLRCEARHGQSHPVTGKRVQIQLAHMNHAVSDMGYGNLVASCDRCHLRHDAKHHAMNAAETRRRKKEMGK